MAPGRERLGELDVRRLWVFRENRTSPAVRALNVGIYGVGLFAHIMWRRPDVVSASTFPPVFAGWMASLACRLTGSRFIYHMQDIHPEVSQILGDQLGGNLLAGVLRWLDNQTLRRSSAIVVLSEDMADTLRARGLGALPITVINNFALDTFGAEEAPPSELRKPKGQRRVIFAGNLGRFQNLPRLVEGIVQHLETEADLELLLLGDGSALSELKRRWGAHPQVKFGPFLPIAQAKVLMAEADVGLVSLQKDIYKVAYPSKVLTYLALGLPILALVEPQSNLSQQLEREGLGCTPVDSSPEAIAATLEKLLKAPERRAATKRWYEANGARDKVLSHWEALIGAGDETEPEMGSRTSDGHSKRDGLTVD